MRWVLLCGTLGAGATEALSAQDRAVALRLVQAYPAHLGGVEGDQLIWKDGTRMPLRRVNAPTYVGLLNAPGLLNQLDTRYPACAPLRTPARNEDPGRVRYEPLFRKMYGGTSQEVQRHLVAVNWFGQRLLVTRVNGAAASLRQVAQDLVRRPHLLPYVRPSAGTFLWRKVAGTPRLSAHAFGAAIDLNTAQSNYWRWDGYTEGQAGIRYRNRMPAELVHLFERRGWIWGGRWYHYDTMHFEYRPELTQGPGCRAL